LVDANGTTIGSTSWTLASGKATTTLSTEEEIGAGGAKTYTLKADVAGTLASGDNIAVNLASVATGVATTTNSAFIWSDRSTVPHSMATLDWWSDYLVKTIPALNSASIIRP
jgi:hypothetical protein